MRSMNILMKDIGTISSVELQDHAGLAQTCSTCTVRNFLSRNDFGFYQCRRKVQLTPEDSGKRLKLCKKCKQLLNDFWETGISFYLDGAGFAHFFFSYFIQSRVLLFVAYLTVANLARLGILVQCQVSVRSQYLVRLLCQCWRTFFIKKLCTKEKTFF